MISLQGVTNDDLINNCYSGNPLVAGFPDPFRRQLDTHRAGDCSNRADCQSDHRQKGNLSVLGKDHYIIPDAIRSATCIIEAGIDSVALAELNNVKCDLCGSYPTGQSRSRSWSHLVLA